MGSALKLLALSMKPKKFSAESPIFAPRSKNTLRGFSFVIISYFSLKYIDEINLKSK